MSTPLLQMLLEGPPYIHQKQIWCETFDSDNISEDIAIHITNVNNSNKDNIICIDINNTKYVFRKVRFDNVEFCGVKFIKCDFTLVEFIDCKFENVDFIECVFDKDSEITGCRFIGCELRSLVFEGCYVNDNYFHECDLINVPFHNTYHTWSTFNRTYNTEQSPYISSLNIHEVPISYFSVLIKGKITVYVNIECKRKTLEEWEKYIKLREVYKNNPEMKYKDFIVLLGDHDEWTIINLTAAKKCPELLTNAVKVIDIIKTFPTTPVYIEE